MSSYSTPTYIHPSQYAPHPNPPHQQPPYPTTPGAAPQQAMYGSSPSQPGFYASSPAPQPQQATYGSSPQQQQYFPPSPAYSSSGAQLAMPLTPLDQQQRTRRSSSMHSQRPQFTSAPIPIAIAQRPPIYARAHNESHGSHHSSHSHMHDPYAWADGEDSHESRHSYRHSADGERERRDGGGNWGGGLDEDTLRSYEKRYAKDRELEKRPTVGGSLMSALKMLGGKRE